MAYTTEHGKRSFYGEHGGMGRIEIGEESFVRAYKKSESIKELHEALKRAPSTLRRQAGEYGLDWPGHLAPWPHWPKVDALIQEGASQPRIAWRAGTTRQNIHHYLRDSGQHEEWRRAREDAA